MHHKMNDDDEQVVETYEARRVCQLDASELDDEVFSLTRTQLRNIFKYLKPDLMMKFAPELDAALRYLLWHFSVRRTAATVGQRLLDLRYVNTSSRESRRWMTHRQRVLYALLTIGAAWIDNRLDDFVALTRHMSAAAHLWRAVRLMVACIKAASFINFCVFLMRGRYAFIVERLLGARAVYPSQHMLRQVGFEMMDRELLWHGFAEFMFFLLPLINFRKLKNFLVRNLWRNARAESGVSKDAYRECVVCADWPTHPHSIVNCPHVFCYFCLQGNYKADTSYCCPVCGTKITDADCIQPVVLPLSVSAPGV